LCDFSFNLSKFISYTVLCPLNKKNVVGQHVILAALTDKKIS
jgi:hypothetical protein